MRVCMYSKNKIILISVFLFFYGTAFSASFDCTKASRPIDKAICNDPDLSALDDRLATAYSKEFAVNPGVKEEQREWLKSLKQCSGDLNAIASCLKPMFVDRIKNLEKQQASALLEQPASIAAEKPSQQNTDASDQAQAAKLTENRVKTPSAEEAKSSFGSGMIAAVIAAILAALFFVFKKKRAVESNDQQESAVKQSTPEATVHREKEISKKPERNLDECLCIDCGWHGHFSDTKYDKEFESNVCPECGSVDIELGTFPKDESLYSSAQCNHCDWVGKEDDCSRNENDELVCPSCGAEDDITLSHQPVPGWFGGNRELILIALTTHGSWLKDVPAHLQGDRELTLAAVRSPHLALRFASEQFRNDKEIVKAAITKSAGEFEYASEKMRDDQELTLMAVSNSGYELQNASERLRNDKAIVLAAVSESGNSLQFASPALQDDREVVMAAVLNEGSALEYASNKLRADEKIVEAAVANDVDALEYSMLERTSENSKKLAVTISSQVIEILDGIMDSVLNDEQSLLEWKNSGGSYKVRPGYAYDKFYLDRITGSYDMSLQGLIHHMMNEEGIYKRFLSNQDLSLVEECISENPEGIWGVDDLDTPEGELTQEILDTIYLNCIKHVGERLREASLVVTEFESEGYIE